MNKKIAILSDVHIGLKTDWKLDESGISLKVIDNINELLKF